MTRSLRLYVKARSAIHRAEVPRWTRRRQTIGASVCALGLALAASLAPQPAPTAAEELAAYLDAHAQSFEVPALVESTAIARDTYSATPGIATLAAGGTNHDWAKLVLLFAKLPMTESNVTVFTRWMRQENGTNDWWNRNNPLNNGWGSGGGSGLGSYDSLVIAAENAADALLSHSGYRGIVAAFAVSAPTEQIEQAIWASPWASGHYANGGHWSYVPVPVVVSPSGTW
jgi:hypothetical protein